MPPEADAIEKPDTTAAAATKDAPVTESKTEGEAAPAEGKDKATPATGADGKAVDAEVTDAGKKTGDPSLLDDGEEDDADADPADDKATPDKDGKGAEGEDDKADASTFADTRTKAIGKRMAKLEAQLAKKLTAAELPKALAKEKAKIEATLARYGNAEDALLALADKEELIRSGKHKQPLAEDASEEEKAADRKERGIPAEAKDYEVAKVPGYTWTEGDTPLLEDFKTAAHAGDFTQAQLDVATSWFARRVMAAREATAERRAEKDREDEHARVARRRENWGADAKAAQNVITRALDDPELFPNGLGEAIKEARLPDGTLLTKVDGWDRMVFAYGHSTKYAEPMPSGDAESAQLSSREEELNKIRNTDIERFRREKNGKGQTLMQEMMEIQEKKASRGGRRAA